MKALDRKGDFKAGVLKVNWGRGPAEKLAAGFKAALDELGKGGDATYTMGH